MSRGRRRRAGRSRLANARVRAVVANLAGPGGCGDCDAVTDVHEDEHGVVHVVVQHDEDCSALRRGALGNDERTER